MVADAVLPIVLAFLGSQAPGAAHHVVRDSGVEFRWVVRDAQLHGCMLAATTGWVTVGFNTRDGLAGARLVMGRLVRDRTQVQVHIAKPPMHVHRRTANGMERVTNVAGEQADGRTVICFSMPLAAADAEDVSLAAGRETTLVLAWSHESDFDHHSAQRGSVRVKL